MLAKDAVNCARKLAQKKARSLCVGRRRVRGQPAFARKVSQSIRERWPQATVQVQKHDGVWGAIGGLPKIFRKTPPNQSLLQS